MRKEVLDKIKKGHSLSTMQIKDDEISEIMATLKHLNPKMSVLDLDGNELTDIGASILADYLIDFPNLKQLSLQFNDIDEDGVRAIYALKRTLEKLDIMLHGNKIKDVDQMLKIQRETVMGTLSQKIG